MHGPTQKPQSDPLTNATGLAVFSKTPAKQLAMVIGNAKAPVPGDTASDVVKNPVVEMGELSRLRSDELSKQTSPL
jgi:hypothetical protein